MEPLGQGSVALEGAAGGSASSKRRQFKHLKRTELEQSSPSALPLEETEASSIYSSSNLQPYRQRRVVSFVCPQPQKTRSFVHSSSTPQLCTVSSLEMPPSEFQPPATPVETAWCVCQGTTTLLSTVLDGSDVVRMSDYSLTTGWDDPDNMVTCKIGEVLEPADLAVYDESYARKSFTVKGNLGQGGFGTVVLAWENLDCEVALKALPSTEGKGDRAKERVRREIEAQRAVRHLSSVQLLATFSNGQRFFLILEYARNGSLARRLPRKGGTGLEPSFAARATLEIANALQVLHAHGFVHRDVKPGNIVFGENDDAMVCDYGICGPVGTNGPCTTYYGTGEYCAPAVDGKGPYDEAVDSWALGVVLYEMLTGDLPFKGYGKPESGEVVELSVGLAVDATALDLIRRLLRIDPKDRLPLSEVCIHPWIVENAG